MRKKIQSIFLVAILASAAIATETDNFGGLGISFYAGESGVKIAGVVPNSPAGNIGLQAGDLILSANGTEFSAIDPSQQVSYLRGKAGSSISLVVERAGEKLSLSTKRAELSIQSLSANDISAWYGKSEGLTAEEINHLANQKIAEGYQFLGVMQHGIPVLRSAENLNANAVQQISIKTATETDNSVSEPQGLSLNDKAASLFVNAKGAHVKKQNGNEKKPAAPVYRVK
ncbi:MAG: PDZ domain-containing protein [Fibromonadaceae bacterium]|jgi:membrane-associated protease RseP (regulator of RpoE activity)|nr:PDZ domain-containing protein [Fibromonadaceae bacterium]